MTDLQSLLAREPIKAADMVGRTFGRLTVIKRAPNGPKWKVRFECRCSCGVTVVVASSHLCSGNSQSCGCLRREYDHVRTRKHGLSTVGKYHPLYSTWSQMIRRCYRTTCQSYADYGARGITVCDRWRFGENGETGTECFIGDMGDRPKGTSLDRRDNQLGYSPTNCRWATRFEQMRNTRGNRTNVNQVAEIKRRLADGASRRELASEFSLSLSLINNIASERSWADVAPANGGEA